MRPVVTYPACISIDGKRDDVVAALEVDLRVSTCADDDVLLAVDGIGSGRCIDAGPGEERPQDVAGRTDGKVQLSAGTLYSSIRRMLEQGVIEELRESPDPSSTDERRRYYRLTKFGKRVAAAEVQRLNAMLQQARATGLVRGT